MVTTEGDRCRSARLAACGAGPAAMRLRGAEEILEQGGLDDRYVDDAAARAAELVDPSADLHASVEYRRHLTRVLTRRALKQAVGRSARRRRTAAAEWSGPQRNGDDADGRAGKNPHDRE